MTALEVAAYLGALAWLPQVGQWIYAWAKSPKLKLLSGETIGASYTGYGQVVALTTAISCDKRDALIKSATLNIAHEKGDKRQLKWVWLREAQGQISIPNLPGAQEVTLDFAKNQPALAMKVGPQLLTEKVITFTDREFQSRSATVTQTLLRHFEYLARATPDPVDALIKSKEFMEAQDFFTREFYWKEGRYTFEVELAIVGRPRSHKENFQVIFTKSEADELKANIGLYEGQVRGMLLLHSGQQVAWPQWKWVNPAINPFS